MPVYAQLIFVEFITSLDSFVMVRFLYIFISIELLSLLMESYHKKGNNGFSLKTLFLIKIRPISSIQFIQRFEMFLRIV